VNVADCGEAGGAAAPLGESGVPLYHDCALYDLFCVDVANCGEAGGAAVPLGESGVPLYHDCALYDLSCVELANFGTVEKREVLRRHLVSLGCPCITIVLCMICPVWTWPTAEPWRSGRCCGAT